MKEKLPIPGANVSIAKRQTCGNGFRRNFQLEVKRGDVLSFRI
jgi:hypothetical protein